MASTITPVGAAQKYLIQLLVLDSTLMGLLGTAISGYNQAVYDSVAPQPAKFPLVVMQLIIPGLQHDKLQEATTVMTRLRFFVKIIYEDHQTIKASEGAQRIQLALKEKVTNQDEYAMNVFEVDTFSYPEDDGGKIYYHAGGIYEVIVRPENL